MAAKKSEPKDFFAKWSPNCFSKGQILLKMIKSDIILKRKRKINIFISLVLSTTLQSHCPVIFPLTFQTASQTECSKNHSGVLWAAVAKDPSKKSVATKSDRTSRNHSFNSFMKHRSSAPQIRVRFWGGTKEQT